MKALLDTHVFLWWITDAPQLPPHIRELIADGGNELFLSAASCWEIAIKARLGKITLPARPDVYIADQMAENAVQGLPIEVSHAFQVFHLPLHHRDPFDRMLIAQSQVEHLPVITSDPLFSKYKVKTLWDKK
jgi:PIN domain nuclease of toxin-antitoxin system